MKTVFETYADLQAALDRNPCESAFAFRFLPEYMPAGFRCAQCGQVKPFKLGGGTGYGIHREPDGREVMNCYACCSERERESLIAEGRGILYLSGLPCFGMAADGKGLRLTDWPGGLNFPVSSHWTGRHNWAGKAHFVRFTGPDGREWSGKQYGENTQICHVRRLKGGR